MFAPCSTLRPLIACVLASALLACVMTGPAAARIDPPVMMQDTGSPDARDAAPTSSLAGTTSETAPAPTGDDTAWLPIALAIAATLAIGAAGGAQLHRLRVRRRHAAGVAA